MLFLLYIQDICKSRPGSLNVSYIDDFCFASTSTSFSKNCRTLQRTAIQLFAEAREAAIEFEIDKTELLHVHRGRQEALQPIELEGQVFAPSKVVRWLGFFLDSKLSFKTHVEKKTAAAQKVFAQLQRLGNTQQGLTVQALRQLYLACITTVADYGAQLWWHTERKGMLLKHYNALQNLALPRMLGAFKSSPTMAMEIEAAIPHPVYGLKNYSATMPPGPYFFQNNIQSSKHCTNRKQNMERRLTLIQASTPALLLTNSQTHS